MLLPGSLRWRHGLWRLPRHRGQWLSFSVGSRDAQPVVCPFSFPPPTAYRVFRSRQRRIAVAHREARYSAKAKCHRWRRLARKDAAESDCGRIWHGLCRMDPPPQPITERMASDARRVDAVRPTAALSSARESLKALRRPPLFHQEYSQNSHSTKDKSHSRGA